MYEAILSRRCHLDEVGVWVDAGTVVPGAIPGQKCGVVEVAVGLMAQGKTARTRAGVCHCRRNCVEENI